MNPSGRLVLPALLDQHPQSAAACRVLETLIAAGHRALLAGGCVRDLHLGKTAQDLDVATSATPDEVEKLFPKTVAVGKAFGVILVIDDGHELEVATFRKDGTYADGRRPDAVIFSDEKEDALRRDFTVNALFWDPVTAETLDYVDGLQDLKDKRLRTVGEASRRFSEDQLRLLRAVRFSLQLDFQLEPVTAQAVRELAPKIRNVSGERVRDEILKCARLGRPAATIALLADSGLLEALYPEWAARGTEPAELLSRPWPKAPWSPDEAAVARLFAPFIKDSEDHFFAKWRGPRAEEKFLRTAWTWFRKEPEFWTRRKGERLKLWSDPAVLEGLFLAAVLKDTAATPAQRGQMELLYRQTVTGGGALPAPLLKGDDLKTVAQGPALGKALDEAYLSQLEGKFNDKNAALTYILGWMRLAGSGGPP